MTKINMKSSPPKSLKQIQPFLQMHECNFSFQCKKERNRFIRQTTWNLKYKFLRKKQKGEVIKYVQRITGLSNVQAKRLLALACKGKLKDPKTTKNSTSYRKKYTINDIFLLAEFDDALTNPNGVALQENLRRMFNTYRDKRFCRLKDVSHGHIYNLRRTKIYKKYASKYQHTKPVLENEIGVREKPAPNEPGFLRVDSVHGGDLEKEKGVYYINLVDELTQWEIVVCVEGISERYLTKIWNGVLKSFPFQIKQFHSDNGSEIINKIVDGLLNKLAIKQSKSRPRHHNDNGLVETKNGWIIRKHFGYAYVKSTKAPLINIFLRKYFNDFLNYHRPCAFPTRERLGDGKVRVKYKKENYKTPYEKLKEIDPKGKSLRASVNYASLDMIEMEDTDYDYAVKMKKKYQELLRVLFKKDST